MSHPHNLDIAPEPRSPLRSPTTPNHPLEDARLLSPSSSSQPPTPLTSDFSSPSSNASPPTRPPHRTSSSPNFVPLSSPLNPSSAHMRSPTTMSSRPASRTSAAPPLSDELLAGLGLGMGMGSGLPARGSMILYRLADDESSNRLQPLPLPPKLGQHQRDSVISSSGDSMMSFSSDSKYPSGPPTIRRGLIPYAYDPLEDLTDPVDDEDLLHDPTKKGHLKNDKGEFPWRGIVNVGVLILLILALLCLFIFYPVLTFFRDQAKMQAIDGNIRINATGQNPVLFQMPEIIDPETPEESRTRIGFDGLEYELVFSDEFNTPGRSFYPGDDPYWEAVDLWYGATGDLEWYDPQQVTTRDGALVITMDSTATTQAGLTPGSTAPFTAAQNHDLNYRSGMIQSWNKFCFTTGYIEVSVTFPGENENAEGYWPGAWTMGNLARPGYPSTTDGTWPYTYDSCDVGTFPNQTNPDGQGPAAALRTNRGRTRYNNELSWLSGQRLSACSCPNSDHPGPSHNVGRGAPEIDIFEAERDKDAVTGHVVSQSAQFAPFSHDYFYVNDSQTTWVAGNSLTWTNFDSSRTRANDYRGSAVQQSVSGLTRVPSDMFQGPHNSPSTQPNFKTFGFEYWSNPDDRESGYVQWQVDGRPSHRVLASAVGPDPIVGGMGGEEGSGVGQRLIPEEPMAVVFNLGISPNWQPVTTSTLIFPAELKVDYVRIYQRKGHTNVGCDPRRYPTKKYIDDHLEAYMDVNKTVWDWEKPKNSLYSGGC